MFSGLAVEAPSCEPGRAFPTAALGWSCRTASQLPRLSWPRGRWPRAHRIYPPRVLAASGLSAWGFLGLPAPAELVMVTAAGGMGMPRGGLGLSKTNPQIFGSAPVPP